MKFFADTASIDEIRYCFSRYVHDGITTNPKILETTGDLSQGPEATYAKLIGEFPNVPISLETDLNDFNPLDFNSISPESIRDALLSQAYKLSGLSKDVVVKIPICQGGLMATEILSKEGIKTNVTACMTPRQALTAANSGATYVSLFANRMLDSYIISMSGHSLNEISSNPNWKDILKTNKDKYFESAWAAVLSDIAYVASSLDGSPSELIVGSIRSPEDILKIVKASPQIITIPTGIVRGLEKIVQLKEVSRSVDFRSHNEDTSLDHPMTQYTIQEFEAAARSYKS